METSDEIIQLNLELNALIGESFQLAVDALQKSEFKATGKALLSYIPRIGYINNSILDCYRNKNGYAAGILFRSMVEHSFRHLYIYTRALNENNDDVGNEYYGKLKGSEDLESFTKMNNYTKVVHPDRTPWSTKGEHNKNISEVGKKFNLSKIFFYLMDNFPEDKKVIQAGMKDYLLSRLNQYTLLSSYVHGGPTAETNYEALIIDPAKMDMHLNDITKQSFGLYKSVVESTILFADLVTDVDLWSHFEKVSAIGKGTK